MPHPPLSYPSQGSAAAVAARAVAGLVSVDGRTFPLRSVVLRAHAEGGVAESRLSQSYANPYDEPLEVLYTMPLPADGAVVGYTIRLGEQVIEGEVRSREEARETYRRALAEGRTAGLLEQVRPDSFVQQLGSLPAKARVEVEIRVLQPLVFSPATRSGAPAWEYRFPTVVGVRFMGESGRVPDAPQLDPNRADHGGTPARMELALSVADGDPGRLAPTSPSHPIRVESSEAGSAVSLDGPARLDRDLVVRWVATAEQVEARLVEGGGLPGDDGRYGLLTVTPPTLAGATLARDVTLLIDASGSMGGEPLDHCKRVARSVLESLGPEDRFELLAFSSVVETLVKGPTAATPREVKRGLARLDKLQAGGGTQMTQAVIEALAPLRADSHRQVILLTDGFIGFEGEVVGEVIRRLEPGCCLHAVGVGSAPNRSLTRNVARAGRGVELFASDEATAREAAEQLLQATVAPVLTDLVIAGSACRARAPEISRDVLAGRPAVVALELEARGGTIEVRARLAGSEEPWIQTIQVAPRSEAPAPAITPLPLGALFGREAVADAELRLAAALGDHMHESGESSIEQLGLRHRIATRRTSLVAVCDEPTVDPQDPRRRRALEVELPRGVSAGGVGLLQVELDYFCIEDPSEARRVPQHAFGLGRFEMIDEADLVRSPPARTVRVEGDLLVLEFEASRGGPELPRGGCPVIAHLASGELVTAEVDGDLSTRAGRHARGLTLRLALRRTDGEDWKPCDGVLCWRVRGVEDVELEFSVPQMTA